MKLLIINFEYPPLGGGGGVATQVLAQALAERHTVVVLTTGFTGLAGEESLKGVLVRRVPVFGRASLPTASLISLLSFVPAALFVGWRLCRQHTFDVINAQFVLPSGLVGMVLSRLFGVPLVLSFIGGDVFDPSKGTSPHRHAVLRWLVRLIAARATVRTAISEDTKRHVRELHQVTQPITVTHLGIEPITTSPVSRQELRLPTDAFVFITIGRLIPRKGYEALLRAWQHVPGAYLVILGSGPLRQGLETLTERLGLRSRVSFRGFVDEKTKHQLLLAVDGYVSAAVHEGFGIVFLEAMEAGLPIVAINEGGHTDFLVPNENAYFVPPDEPEQLALAVRRLINNPDEAARLGARNREAVKGFYLDTRVRVFEQQLFTAVKLYARSS